MSRIAQMLYMGLPHVFQEVAIAAHNLTWLRKTGGCYERRKAYHATYFFAPIATQLEEQGRCLDTFLRYVWATSPYYRSLWSVTHKVCPAAGELVGLPVIAKEQLRAHLDEITSLPLGEGVEGHTGGTTGKSLSVRYRWEDIQDRQAALDFFREMHGWRLGTRTAWFSGKNFLNERDLERHRYWKTDWRLSIRYYSTFHMAEDNLPHYIRDLNQWCPDFLSGFPSSVFEIADYARRTATLIRCQPKALFSTAETVLPHHVRVVEEQFHTKVRDQYASSEGAPFIITCTEGHYHFLPSTGVLEILDQNGKAADEGEAVVTSFSTYGTPLVRYRIGDRMAWDRDGGVACACGSESPRIKWIDGRVVDGLWSAERGRINLGNVSNCVKETPGVLKFQAVQERRDEIRVRLVVDPKIHNSAEKEILRREFEARLGNRMVIQFEYCEDIPREPSGKYRIVKNLLSAEEMR
jgi:phenylacetate-CoA ligase